MAGTGMCREEPGLPEREGAEVSPGVWILRCQWVFPCLTSGEGGGLW